MENIAELIDKLANLKISQQSSKTYNDCHEKIIKNRIKEWNNKIGSLDDGFDCPICKNKGYIEIYDNDAMGSSIYRTCSCQNQRIINRRLKKSGLEWAVKENTFESFQDKEEWQKSIKKKAKEFINSNENFFFIGGQNGSGKTHICTAIFGEFIKQGANGQYEMWGMLSSILKSGRNDDFYHKKLEEIKNIEVLYIDDLFKSRSNDDIPTAADVGIAFDIINFRYINRKGKTIISSERYLTDILKIDQAIGGRIKEKCGDFCFDIARDNKKDWRILSN